MGSVLQVNGSYAIYRDFEITDSGSSRNVASTGSAPIGSTIATGSIRFNSTNNAITDYRFDRNTYPQRIFEYPFNFAYLTSNPISSSGYSWWNKQSPGIGYGVLYTTWQEDMGYDRNGKYELGVRSGVKSFLLPNDYDSNLATLIIYNWDKLNSVNISPGSFLKAGDTYTLHSALDYHNDKKTGLYGGGDLSVSMINHTVVAPRGYATTLGPNTFPEFGVFIVRKTPGVAPAAPSNLKIQ